MPDFVIQIIMDILGKLITPESVKNIETEVINLLKAAAAKTPTKLDDEAIELLAKALLGT